MKVSIVDLFHLIHILRFGRELIPQKNQHLRSVGVLFGQGWKDLGCKEGDLSNCNTDTDTHRYTTHNISRYGRYINILYTTQHKHTYAHIHTKAQTHIYTHIHTTTQTHKASKHAVGHPRSSPSIHQYPSARQQQL
jgi:hypothetical protein